ncbi:MAG TPA: Coenzyme F420 hydrogenase/dehydrogenase, beta subunit C-terminal domain [Acidimicrobiia bacterium]|jgi:coenzyme F420 hydrogenase subunit beta|nr:Coenzyme F420 hydrogenase/dehydrogenase, beta subunit C-terminal domain [Acidimicrobiia bacterium]
MRVPTPADRLNLISQQGLCIGCGLCEAIAGPERIRCTIAPNGYERPVIVGDLDHATVDAVCRACPGVVVTGLPEDAAAGATLDSVWGPWRRIVMAWAGDPAVRYAGSTGGVLTALGMYLLDSGEVDAVLHAGPSIEHPSFGESRISRTSAEVLEAVGSRYGPTAVLTRLEEALGSADRIAVIAKPCDLSALRLRARDEARIEAQVQYLLAMVCGGFMAPEGMAERMTWFGVAEEEVTGVRYRGNGCPGPTVFERGDREPVSVSYLDFWGDDESRWTLPYRCKICPDGTGEAADLVAADTWPGAAPTAEWVESDPGSNAVIARTASGEQLLARAAAAGHIALGELVTVADLDLWQPHQVRKKEVSWARQAGRRVAGAVPIEIEGLRSDQLARTQPVGTLLEEGRGSIARVRDGRADEPVPVAASDLGAAT